MKIKTNIKIISIFISLIVLASCSSNPVTNASWANKDNALKPDFYNNQLEEVKHLKMYKIAIVPFTIEQENISDDLNSNSISKDITQDVMSQFSLSKKFRVLSRNVQDEEAYQKEISLINENQNSNNFQMKAGKKLGADYLVVGNITYISLNQSHKNFYGTDFNNWIASIGLNYRVINLETMEVSWANSINTTLSTDKANEVMNNGGDKNSVISQLLRNASKNITTQVIDDLYPVLVVLNKDNTVYLNQGVNRLKVGQKYIIHGQYTLATDPETGRQLNLAGKSIATIEIDSVSPNYSIATILHGNSDEIVPGLSIELTK